jgi:hypothetical protein
LRPSCQYHPAEISNNHSSAWADKL